MNPPIRFYGTILPLRSCEHPAMICSFLSRVDLTQDLLLRGSKSLHAETYEGRNTLSHDLSY